MRKFQKKIVKETLDMAWPAMMESFFVALAGLIDSLMVSSMGSNAVAAVGLTTQPKFIGLSLFLALNVAISALVARRRGEQKKRSANQILYTAMVFVVIAAVVLSVFFVVMADPLMRLCGSKPETHDSAVIYFQIVMGGMIFNCLQIDINAAQRGAGNTRISMKTNVTSSLVNICFNYLLIQGNLGFPKLGMVGAAIATVLGTVVACIMSILSLCKSDTFVSIPYIRKEKIKPTRDALKSLIKVGYSVFLEQILMRIGFMLTAVMAADQGTAVMAAHQVGMNLLGLSFAFGDGLQVAAVALIGHSLGSGDPERAKECGHTCQMIGGVITVGLTLIYLFGGRFLMRLFFQEEEIVSIGVQIMHVIIFILIFQIRQVIYMGCLRGAGDTFYTAVVTAVSVTVIRTVGSYVLCYWAGLGIIGIWLGVLCDQMSRYIFASIRFKQGKWVNIHI